MQLTDLDFESCFCLKAFTLEKDSLGKPTVILSVWPLGQCSESLTQVHRPGKMLAVVLVEVEVEVAEDESVSGSCAGGSIESGHTIAV